MNANKFFVTMFLTVHDTVALCFLFATFTHHLTLLIYIFYIHVKLTVVLWGLEMYSSSKLFEHYRVKICIAADPYKASALPQNSKPWHTIKNKDPGK